MRVVIQRVKNSSVEIDNKLKSEIGRGLLVLVGICENDNKIEYAVMAIENSTAGSIIPNYALIDEYEVSIVGEYYLQITHNLMAL